MTLNYREYSLQITPCLNEFAYDLNFIHRIVTYPDLSLICYNPSIVQLSLNSALQGNRFSSQSNSAARLRYFGYYCSTSLTINYEVYMAESVRLTSVCS